MASDNIFLVDTRVYIAGVLMPTMAVSITSSFNTPPTANITLPADPRLFTLGRFDRVPVLVFIRETMVDSEEFILLFEGFISGRSYMNTATQREINVQAIAYMDMLNDAQLTIMSSVNGQLMSTLPSNSAPIVGTAFMPISFPSCLFVYGLQEEGKPLKIIKYPSQYLENVLTFVQKSGPKDETAEEPEEPSYGAANGSVAAKYYSNLSKLLHLLDRYAELPYLDTPADDKAAFPMLKWLQAAAMLNLLTYGASEDPGYYNAMGLLNFLVGELEYEFAMIASPAYHASMTKEEKEKLIQKLDENNNATNSQETAKESLPGNLLNVEEDTPAKLVTCCLKPIFTDAIPPQCNIIFRCQVDSLTARTNYKGDPTRIRMKDEHGILALLTPEQQGQFLRESLLLGYYPSEQHPGLIVDNTPDIIYTSGLVGNELLTTEEFTGPWLGDITTPRWLNYLGRGTDDAAFSSDVERQNVFRERYMHRQMLNKVYIDKTLEVSGAFDPYITPGFPGVVYDSADSGFSFAGHVVSVQHTITSHEVTTQTMFNFVRPLEEAAAVQIPHPLEELQEISQSSKKMTAIYQSLLGTIGEEQEGTTALTFTEVHEKFASIDKNSRNVQSNLKEAYKTQKRNIVTFDQYLDFMGLTVEETGSVPGGSDVPLVISGDFLAKRSPLYTYQYKLVTKQPDPSKETTPSAEETPAETPDETIAATTVAEELKGVHTLEKEDVVALLKEVSAETFSKYVYS